MSNIYKVTLTFKVESENFGTLQEEIGRIRKIIKNVLLEFADDKTVKDYSSATSSAELIE